MSNPSDKIRTIRKDLSPYLFNFLKDNNAPSVLHKILNERCLISKENDYICFTDAPITCYLSNLEYFNGWKNKGYSAMYSKYGIGISRDYLIREFGARNVIYGPKSDKNLLDKSIQWRFQELDIERDDFTWLREWRVHKRTINLKDIPQEHIIFIVPTEDEIGQYEIDYIDTESKKSKKWIGFAIDQIKEIDNDFSLSAQTQTLNYR